MELLRKAGIEVGDKPILQFYPQGVEQVLARLEQTYKGRAIGRDSGHTVQGGAAGGGYGFEVIDQQTVR